MFFSISVCSTSLKVAIVSSLAFLPLHLLGSIFIFWRTTFKFPLVYTFPFIKPSFLSSVFLSSWLGIASKETKILGTVIWCSPSIPLNKSLEGVDFSETHCLNGIFNFSLNVDTLKLTVPKRSCVQCCAKYMTPYEEKKWALPIYYIF